MSQMSMQCSILQDLVGMTVVQHGSGTTLGNVVDIYDGTGPLQFQTLLLL